MDEKERQALLDAQKAALAGAMAEGLAPIHTEIKGLRDENAALKAEAASLKTAVAEEKSKREELEKSNVVRLDANGRPFLFGKAPARVGSLGSEDEGLSFSKVWRSTMLGGSAGNTRAHMESIASAELAMSKRLTEAGYRSEYMGSVLMPLSASLIMEPVDEKGNKLADFSAIRKEVAERLPIRGLDPAELAWHLKRNREFALNDLGLSKKDLQLGDDTLGGFLVPSTQADSVLDLLRPRVAVIRAGAREVPLPPSGNIAYPRMTSDPAFTWTDPDTTTDASTSNIGLGVVRLQAKSLRGFVTIPNDLIRYSSPAVELLVRAALANRAGITEDNTFLEGVGTSLAPKGIISYPQSTAEIPAVNKITLHVAQTVGANGNTFEPEDVAKIIALYYMGNDPDEPTAWITRPLMWAAIQNRRADAVTAADAKGPFLFALTRGEIERGVPTMLGGTPVVSTVQASNNRVKGSGTNLVYALFGNFRRVLIGRVGVIELAVSEHVKFLQDKTIIRAVLRSDMGLEHEEAFVFTDSLLES